MEPVAKRGTISGKEEQLKTGAKKTFKLALCAALIFQAASSFAETSKTRSKYREGEILGPDSSTEPLPVELVEDPALHPPKQKIETNIAKSQKLPPPPKADKADEAAGEDSSAGAIGGSDSEATTTLNAKDVEIATLVKSFSKIAKRNYIVDSNVKGKVTIHLAEPVTTGEALRILDSVLLLKGFTTVPVGPNTYKVVQAKDAKKTTIPTMDDDGKENSDALVTRLMRLKNVPANDLQQSLQQFISPDGLITIFTGTNSLIVIDSAANIERVEKLVKQLDVPALDQDVTVIPVKYAEAKDVADKVNQILGQDDKSNQQVSANVRPGTRTMPISNPGQMNNPVNTIGQPPAPNVPGIVPITGDSGSRRSLPAKVIADERTNSVIVVADPDTTAKIQALVEQLDSKVDLSGGRFYVIRLKHADAEELSDVLNTVLGGGGGGSSRRDTSTSGSSLSRRSRGDSSNTFGRGFGGPFGNNSRGRLGGGSDSSSGSTGNRSAGGGGFTVTPGQQGSSKVNFEGEVSVAPDPSTNSLIVNASRNDYLKINEVVDLLDVKRKQVLVESTILEVSMDDRENMGIELIGSAATDKGGIVGINNFGGITNLLTNPAGLTDLTIAAASSGSITLPAGVTIPSQALILTAVSNNQNVNVLSNPTILTTDNQEAEIVVGQNIPIVTSRGTNSVNLDNTFNNIDRQDVGITLRLTPQIGAADFVTLRIFVEISDVVEGTESNQNGPTTTVRTSETNVEVKDGQMVITGGLLQDNVTSADRGIPYWKDIPVLGNFFRQTAERRRRTNLLIFITPRIVSDQYDARELTTTRRDALEGTIAEQGVEPNRSERLRSDDIDRVFEKSQDSATKPSTITPSKTLSPEEEAAVRRTTERLTSLHIQPTISSNKVLSGSNGNDSNEVYSVTVQPKLPGSQSKVVEKEPAANLQTASIEKLPEPSAPKFYVILRKLGSEGGVVGVEVPGAIDGPAGKFFQNGSRVKRNREGATDEFVCLSRFTSKEDAEKSQLKAGSWFKLPVPEALSLGTGAWTR